MPCHKIHIWTAFRQYEYVYELLNLLSDHNIYYKSRIWMVFLQCESVYGAPNRLYWYNDVYILNIRASFFVEFRHFYYHPIRMGHH